MNRKKRRPRKRIDAELRRMVETIGQIDTIRIDCDRWLTEIRRMTQHADAAIERGQLDEALAQHEAIRIAIRRIRHRTESTVPKLLNEPGARQ